MVAVVKVLGIGVVVVVCLFVDPVLLMWLVSAVRAWWWTVPEMSYGQAFGVSFVVGVSAMLGWLVKGFVTTMLE